MYIVLLGYLVCLKQTDVAYALSYRLARLILILVVGFGFAHSQPAYLGVKRGEREKTLTLQALLISSQNAGVLSTQFTHKWKAEHHLGCYERS